jgi:hypothetical protein
MKNLTIKKTYSVNGVDFETKEEAQMAMAKLVIDTEIPKGFQNVIDKAPEIISALRIITNK